MSSAWEVVIGLEIHTQLATASKRTRKKRREIVMPTILPAKKQICD